MKTITYLATAVIAALVANLYWSHQDQAAMRDSLEAAQNKLNQIHQAPTPAPRPTLQRAPRPAFVLPGDLPHLGTDPGYNPNTPPDSYGKPIRESQTTK